eukprot:contig_24894_g6148
MDSTAGWQTLQSENDLPSGPDGEPANAGDGMFHERISSWEGDTPVSVELESKLMWVQAFGVPEAYGVRVILMERRQAEGVWPATVVPGLLSAVAKLRIE